MMSRKTKIIAKSKHLGEREIFLNTDFIISSGDDKTVRIWKIPPPLSSKQMKKLAKGEDVNGILNGENYCILSMETKHKDSVHCI